MLKSGFRLAERVLWVPEVKHCSFKQNTHPLCNRFPQRPYELWVCELSWTAQRWTGAGSSESHLGGFKLGGFQDMKGCLKLRPLSANHSILINSIPYLQMHSLV